LPDKGVTSIDLQRLGYARDPEKRPGEKPDRTFDTLGLAPLESGDIDLREFATDTNQRSLPSCVGNATADSIEVISAVQGFPQVELSRQFIWTLARMLMQEDGHLEQTGTYIRLAFKVLNKHGVCLEKYWPYESDWRRPPSLKAMRKATSRKIKGYYRIQSKGDRRVNDMLKALRARHPFVFGTQIDDQWGSYDGRSTLHTPEGETAGGHAMLCLGYDSRRGFIVKNSWGDRWGDGGYCYLSEEYMAWKNTWDIWVPTIGKDFGE
jgi:C1A family cysteine protease